MPHLAQQYPYVLRCPQCRHPCQVLYLVPATHLRFLCAAGAGLPKRDQGTRRTQHAAVEHLARGHAEQVHGAVVRDPTVAPAQAPDPAPGALRPPRRRKAPTR